MADAAAPTGVDDASSPPWTRTRASRSACARWPGAAPAGRGSAPPVLGNSIRRLANSRRQRRAGRRRFQKTETGTETKMFLKLRARAACDAARRTDRDSLVAASETRCACWVTRAGRASPPPARRGAGDRAGRRRGVVRGGGGIARGRVPRGPRGRGRPAGRWTVPGRLGAGLGEGDDDMAPEGVAVAEAAAGEEAAEEAAEKKAAAPKRSRHAAARPVKEDGGEGGERLGSSSDGAETRARSRNERASPPLALATSKKGKGTERRRRRRTRFGAATDPRGVFVPPDVSRRFDSARLLVTLDRAAHKDTHGRARRAVRRREAVAATRARGCSARVATDVLGAHVAARAALTADASPGRGRRRA